MNTVAVCRAFDCAVFGEDAANCSPEEKVAVPCELEVHYEPDPPTGVISLSIMDGLPGDRRVLVNSEELRCALVQAGVPWVR